MQIFRIHISCILIFHPISNCYVEEVKPIFKECARILKKGGIFIAGLDNGINFITNDEEKLPEIPLHGLRHTSATLLISQNVDVRTVSGRLGHAQTSTTMDIYSHALKKMDEKAADVLDSLLVKKI